MVRRIQKVRNGAEEMMRFLCAKMSGIDKV